MELSRISLKSSTFAADWREVGMEIDLLAWLNLVEGHELIQEGRFDIDVSLNMKITEDESFQLLSR